MFLVKDSCNGAIEEVNSLETYHKASSGQSPNQSITQRLYKAGDEAPLLLKSGPAGFIVKTTCKFL
jgi:hypothetical protein